MNEQETNQELENFIADWHWDEASHKMTREMGAFLFQFSDSIYAVNSYEATWRKLIKYVISLGYKYGE